MYVRGRDAGKELLELSPKRVSGPNSPSSCSAFHCNTPGLVSFCKLVMRKESLSGLCIYYLARPGCPICRTESASWAEGPELRAESVCPYVLLTSWCRIESRVHPKVSGRVWSFCLDEAFLTSISSSWGPVGHMKPVEERHTFSPQGRRPPRSLAVGGST